MSEIISIDQFQDYVDEFFEPWRFLASFQTEEEFELWLEMGTIEELQNLIGIFDKFHWAIDMILEEINRKIGS